MNPPSALHGAMSRDRKPFTYTPGGLDLSEIKSERMAKRLMINAMNQGVPEVPVHPVHSSTNQSAPVALPNFNCLPVQVFPTFNLPANPKSLLRTRSNPDPREAPIQRIIPPFVNTTRFENNDTFHKNMPTHPQINNSRPMSMYEYSAPPANPYSFPRTNYGSDGYTAPVLPEISYEAEYFCAPPKLYSVIEQSPKLELSEEKDKLPTSEGLDSSIDLSVNPIIQIHDVIIPTITSTTIESMPIEENGGTENEQREVKVVKKQVKKENNVEDQNGNQNGDSNIEAEMTVKLPTKKSAAKTETKVEVVKKILPDGSVEEIKTTTTKTTVDGRTEIKTKTETKTIPKEEESEEEVVEEEEEEEEEEEVADQEEQEEEVVEEPKTGTVTTTVAAPKENGQQSSVVKTEERSETTTTKKVVVVQESPKEESQSVVEEEGEEVEEVEEEVEESEPVTVVLKKQVPSEPETVKTETVEEEEIEENEEETQPEDVAQKAEIEKEEEKKEEDVVEDEVIEVKKEVTDKTPPPKDEEEEEDEYEEAEEAEEAEETELKVEQETKVSEKVEEKEVIEEAIKEEPQQQKEASSDIPADEPKESSKEPEEKVVKVEVQAPEESKPETKEEKVEPEPQKEYKIPIREPSIPLEKVEDVEIKPIGISPIITKTHTENTEIITSTIGPPGGHSTQTEYNKIENIVTVNRTTKILDNSYENLTQQGIPTVRTYFPPPNIDKISTSPLPSRPYQPVYAPEPPTERRHSLLLDRLSTERQMPSDLYQYSNQTYDQPQYQTEPQSEVLTVSNVKPSKITNQQWYQQTKQEQNAIYNNVSSTPTPVGQPWAQQKSQPQPQQQYHPQPQYQAQHQTQPQPHYQAQHQAKPQYQAPPPQQPSYQAPSTPQPQYQPTYTEPTPERAPSSYSTYTPTPTWATNVETPQNNSQPTQYSYLNKDTTDSYQRSTQQYSSSYVPPPWEQDSSYASINNTSQTYYQPAPPQTPGQSFSPAPTQGWKPPAAKFSKNAPISFIPPAPNQSFVRSASNVDPSRTTPGRKTYYSEYERRYISVPDSTYIPSETKYQPQPDPSPQYYYDNNEPSEPVEPQWRKELREFTEKTSQTTTTEQTSVQPPWEAESKFAKTPSVTYTPTPTWSQTLRPRSWRERSFESEYVSQEWPKTNTLGRGRPLSTLGKSVDAAIPERTRGVSVDRYNPNSYHSPAEHPPVQSHTLTTPVAHAGYHNPNVPAYHARASAEPREQPAAYQPRVYRESRASPLQSRSFKYLQWITGTDN